MASSLGLAALLAVAASESIDAMRVAVLEHRVQKRPTADGPTGRRAPLGKAVEISATKNGDFTRGSSPVILIFTNNLVVRYSLYSTDFGDSKAFQRLP